MLEVILVDTVIRKRRFPYRVDLFPNEDQTMIFSIYMAGKKDAILRELDKPDEYQDSNPQYQAAKAFIKAEVEATPITEHLNAVKIEASGYFNEGYRNVSIQVESFDIVE